LRENHQGGRCQSCPPQNVNDRATAVYRETGVTDPDRMTLRDYRGATKQAAFSVA
jgi:hypothetical protein